MSTYSDRVLITLDHTTGSRDCLLKYLFEHGATAVISCIEHHGGTQVKSQARVDDPDDELTEDTRHHLCAVAFGRFHKANLTNRGRKWAQTEFNNLEQHWSVMYCHHHKSKKGKITYSPFPFPEMARYLTVGSDKKDIDMEPLIKILDSSEDEGHRTATAEEVVDLYNSTDTFKIVKKMKMDKTPAATVLQEIYYREGGDAHQTNLFMRYYDKLDVSVIPKLIPSSLKLRPWQEKVISWCKIPRARDTVNGLWLSMASGSGKSVIIESLYDQFGFDNVYSLSIRAHGSYDLISLMDYGGQPIILVDDLTFHVDYAGTPRPTKNMKELLKKMTERIPLSYRFGQSNPTVCLNAKVLVTSNYDLIQEPDRHGKCPFNRRYFQLDCTDFEDVDDNPPVV